ncbi:hypothetical protein [Vibrio alginolyticus]|uniref:hypothetical protein n=1 Tax=Vibrio alginolyticus TaxID=663 RepID=UPI0006CAA0BF|nr:hypothetical protein [Vibrio alginolyticus]KPM95047.1 hypothetical protein AOG25_26505 [Vibrio alginolyticus]
MQFLVPDKSRVIRSDVVSKKVITPKRSLTLQRLFGGMPMVFIATVDNQFDNYLLALPCNHGAVYIKREHIAGFKGEGSCCYQKDFVQFSLRRRKTHSYVCFTDADSIYTELRNLNSVKLLEGDVVNMDHLVAYDSNVEIKMKKFSMICSSYGLVKNGGMAYIK